MAEFNGKQGVWRTVGGRRIFIADGEDLKTAMEKSGKFKIDTTKLEGKYVTLPERTKEEEESDERYANAKAMYKLTGDEKYKKIYQDEIEKITERVRKKVEEEKATTNKAKESAEQYMKDHYEERKQQFNQWLEDTKKIGGEDDTFKKATNDHFINYDKINSIMTEEDKLEVKKLDNVLKENYDKFGSNYKYSDEVKEARERANKIYEKYDNMLKNKEYISIRNRENGEIKKYTKEEFSREAENNFKDNEEKIKQQIETDYALDFGDSSDNYRDTKYVPFSEKEKAVKQSKLENLQTQLDNETNIFKKGEIQEEIYMIRDDFKGTKEEYREHLQKEREKRERQYEKERLERQSLIREQRLRESSQKVKTQKGLKEMADDGLAKDITTYSDEETKKLRKKHGRLEVVKLTKGTYGMNGALLKSSETGEYFVITARNGNLFYWV